MSRSKRKYLFQNDQNTLNGALLAGNNSMAEMLLWSLEYMEPVCVLSILVCLSVQHLPGCFW